MVTLALNLLVMAIAYQWAQQFATGPNKERRSRFSAGCTTRRYFAITVLLFGGGLAIMPTAIYTLTMFVAALIYVAMLRRTQGAGI